MPAVARAVAVADEQRLAVEPDGVAAFRRRRCAMREATGTPACLKAAPMPVRLAETSFLPGSEQDRALVPDEGRVVRVDRVRVAGIVLRDDHLGAGVLEQPTERLVLGLRGRDVRLGAPAVSRQRLRPRGAADERARARAHPTSTGSRTPSRRDPSAVVYRE